MSVLKAVIFDVDGTIAETERDGHRVAFNRAFDEAGIPVHWDVETYGKFLRVGGGKERIRSQLDILDYGRNADRNSMVLSLHKRKTAYFQEIVNSGEVPLRPGVLRLINEIHDDGILLAVASTSHLSAVETVLKKLLGHEAMGWFAVILAGDIVPAKKPDPAIYTLASRQLDICPDECVVIEDSGIGCNAAVSAGMRCVITTNGYTVDELFKGADLVVDSLGDPETDPVTVSENAWNVSFKQCITVNTLKALIC